MFCFVFDFFFSIRSNSPNNVLEGKNLVASYSDLLCHLIFSLLASQSIDYDTPPPPTTKRSRNTLLFVIFSFSSSSSSFVVYLLQLESKEFVRVSFYYLSYICQRALFYHSSIPINRLRFATNNQKKKLCFSSLPLDRYISKWKLCAFSLFLEIHN